MQLWKYFYKNVCILLFYIIYTLQHPYIIIFLVDILLQGVACTFNHTFLEGVCIHMLAYICVFFYRGETAMCKISIWIIEIHKSHFYKMECAMDNNKRVEVIFSIIMEKFLWECWGKTLAKKSCSGRVDKVDFKMVHVMWLYSCYTSTSQNVL